MMKTGFHQEHQCTFGGSYVLCMNLNQQQWQPFPLDAFQAEIKSFFSSFLLNRPLFDNSVLCFIPFSPSLSLCLLVFLNLMKGPHSFFFFQRFQIAFLEFLPCPWPLWEVGSPTPRGSLVFLLVILWVQALNQPPKFCLHLVTLCLWYLLLWIQMRKAWFVLMRRPECQKWRLCWGLKAPRRARAPLA